MGGSVNKIRAWLSELRRRGVFHVTGLYTVGAWAVVQILDAISGPFPLPETALRLIWFAALLGFPVALVFGWRYDVTKHGIVRTHRRISHGEDAPIGRADYGVIGGLALVAAGIVAMTTVGVLDAIEEARLRAAFGPEVIEPQANSIAVLPFGVCAGRESDEALAEGLASEVINRLASQHLLKVIARTSAFTIASFDMPLLEMGQRLGVTHLLTGTVCREGEPLKVTVELLDEKGFVVWSETLRQEVGSAGLVQVTLAGQVVQGVAGALGHDVTLARTVPVDPKAYEHYLIGERFLEAGALDRARTEFEKAREIQPDYPEAVLALGTVAVRGMHGENWLETLETSRPYYERARTMAQQQIDAGTADFRAHFITGQILHTLGRMDEEIAWRKAADLGEAGVLDLKAQARTRLEEAEQHLRTALALNPSNIECYEWLARNLDAQGVARSAESLEVMESALALEPLNIEFTAQVANRLDKRGRYQEAIEMLERFEDLPDPPSGIYWAQLEIMRNRSAGADIYDKVAELLKDHPELFEVGPSGGYFWVIWELPGRLLNVGMREEAEAWYEVAATLPAPGPRLGFFRRMFLAWYLSDVGRKDDALELLMPREMSDEEVMNAHYWVVQNRIRAISMSGDVERAARLTESTRHARVPAFWEERQAGDNMDLAQLYVTLGRDEEARGELETAVAILGAQIDAGIRHPSVLRQMADACAGLGRDDEALGMLEKAVENGAWWSIRLLDTRRKDAGLDEQWARFHDEPRFLSIMDRARAQRDQEAQRLRSTLARRDMEALVAPVIRHVQEFVAARERAAAGA